MSLICDETGKDIRYGGVLMSGTRPGVGFYSALSQEALGPIPESERRKELCEPSDGGVDIHYSTSSEGINGNYTLSGFELGEFAFSISEETALKHIPLHYRRYCVLKKT